ncbi:hypothetical protein SODALDRAFT_362751 [Sodiomyces alkalinus F11]|uniref:Large ribosomal subunit protein mL67 n=1 Tax=Sodiomyces alkalinus (strain CBS 110278 / VKM F-3762 / F11) TaxID=1314773 RepID=A0A3N2PN10_SODAK|nr:hypothetical protein SODALDRAFT_362751 [Sodiomyces alkalinus F11]ROT35902.1 hypothetical protein SODALDRAFT_362751 [Sodiomyces alkalinus F11]
MSGEMKKNKAEDFEAIQAFMRLSLDSREAGGGTTHELMSLASSPLWLWKDQNRRRFPHNSSHELDSHLQVFTVICRRLKDDRWGEQIWVWNHLLENQIIYSHTKVLDSNHALQQLPFIAKKSKPAKLRKDLWRPMAMIQFPLGAGVAGQSAFQKLREFRRRHELEWDDSLFFETEPDPTTGEMKRVKLRSRIERGYAIHDQRANAIADMAAVLAGAGRGSRVWISPAERMMLEEGNKELENKQEGEVDEASSSRNDRIVELRGKRWSPAAPREDDPDRELIKATVYWMNAQDRNYAEKWSDNVTHELFEEAKAAGETLAETGSEPGTIRAELSSA